ncbi:MAG TPA: alkaline phosphatase family protein [Vicinamibacterales bacterium]|nr:alkaline phosphatase family protein [Vicinamibacterales bacterium]
MTRPLAGAALLATAVALSGLASSACRRGPRALPPRKLVVLGFDGLDPDLVQRRVGAGRLPHFARLARRGGLYRLETTVSPESPTAWASFATGVNLGKHNIYDFLVRDIRTYLPDLGMLYREPGRFLFDLIPIRRPQVRSIHGGTSFWVTAGRQGVRASVLAVPVTYPPEDVPNGELLSGLPLPDISATAVGRSRT